MRPKFGDQNILYDANTWPNRSSTYSPPLFFSLSLLLCPCLSYSVPVSLTLSLSLSVSVCLSVSQTCLGNQSKSLLCITFYSPTLLSAAMTTPYSTPHSINSPSHCPSFNQSRLFKQTLFVMPTQLPFIKFYSCFPCHAQMRRIFRAGRCKRIQK